MPTSSRHEDLDRTDVREMVFLLEPHSRTKQKTFIGESRNTVHKQMK